MTNAELKLLFPLASVVTYNNEYYYVVAYNGLKAEIVIAYKENKNSTVNQIRFFERNLGYSRSDMIEATNACGIPNNRIFKIVSINGISLDWSGVLGGLENIKSGTSVFAAGVHSVNVTFTDSFTEDYSIVVSSVDTGDGGNYNAWISNKESTGFTVNISADPGVGEMVSVSWVASRDND